MGVINATPFNAGIGVTGANDGNAICNYRPATEEELTRVAAIEATLAAHNVPLAAASLQFPVRKRSLFPHFLYENDHFTKTGSGPI
jgi:hypothetical protein